MHDDYFTLDLFKKPTPDPCDIKHIYRSLEKRNSETHCWRVCTCYAYGNKSLNRRNSPRLPVISKESNIPVQI